MFAGPNTRGLWEGQKANFQPRLGLAYQINEKMVARAGYGIFYDPIKGAASGTGGGGFTGFNWTTPLLLTAQNDGATSGLNVGAKISDFALPDQNGNQKSLRDLAGPDGLLLVFSRSADW